MVAQLNSISAKVQKRYLLIVDWTTYSLICLVYLKLWEVVAPNFFYCQPKCQKDFTMIDWTTLHTLRFVLTRDILIWTLGLPNTSIITWIHHTGTNQGRISLDSPLLVVYFVAVVNTFIIPTTAWMGMAIAHIFLVDAESSGRAVEEIFMFTGKTIWSRSRTACLTSVRVSNLVFFLFRKPIFHGIFQIVTSSRRVIRAKD